jgi:hypothetical protein
MEAGRRAGVILVLGMGCPSSNILTQRKEEKKRPN